MKHESSRGSLAARRIALALGVVLALPVAGAGQIVITEIMQNPGAVGDDVGEWFELHNAGSTAVDINGWIIEEEDGNPTHTIDNTGGLSIAAGGYIVIARNGDTTANGGVTADYVYTGLVLGNGSDSLVLKNGTTEMDRVEYDNGATFPDPNGASMALKSPDLDNNVGSSWEASTTVWMGSAGDRGTPGEANSAAPPPIEEITAAVFEIQGNGEQSPHVGKLATSNGNVVTALTSNGFFMQTPTASSDNDVDTSDGIFVYLDATPTVEIGDVVNVVGLVQDGSAAPTYGMTRLAADSGTSGASVTRTGSGALPDAVAFGDHRPSPDPNAPSCAIEYECYEGMLISVALGTVATGNQYFGSDNEAEVFFTPTGERAFREPGLERAIPLRPDLPVFDGNPELFELDPDRAGLANRLLNPGSTFSATGVVGYEFSDYELWPTQLTILSETTLPRPVRAAAAGEVTVGSLNVLNLGQSRSATADKVAKISLHVREVLGAPDILGLQEVYTLADLQTLADRIATDDPSVLYSPYLETGAHDPGQNVGFLVRSRVMVDAVTQLGADEMFLNPNTLEPNILHDRPPLLLEAEVDGLAISVIVIHNRSLINVGTDARVREKRLQQAQSVARMAQERQADRLIVVGDYNAYQFSDGLVHVLAQITGRVDPSSALVSGPDLVDPDLTNLISLLPEGERYSYVFRGSAQALDHAVVNEAMARHVVDFAFGRGNADAPEKFERDETSPLGSSDHDGFVVYLSVEGRPEPPPPPLPPPPPPPAEALLRVAALGVVASETLVSYEVRVRNVGPGAASGVVVTSAVTADDATAAVSTTGCDEDPTGVPSCSLGRIGPGQSATFAVHVVTEAAGPGSITWRGAAASDGKPAAPGASGADRVALGLPSAPSSLAAAAMGATEVELRWQDNSTVETGFAVFQQGPGDSTMRHIGMTPAGATSVVVADLVPAVTYRYAVEARNGALASERTPAVSATTWGAEAARCGEDDVVCLGRFQVEAEWTAHDGVAGRGVAERLTRDTGDFWFFSRENIELIVKVLDGCAINGHRWVGIAGLTDVGVTATVRDLQVGTVRSWTSEVGGLFEPVLDTSAFVCEPASDALLGGGVVLSGAPRGLLESALDGSVALDQRPSPADDSCGGPEGTLCLAHGAYGVRASWRAGDRAGDATGIRRTADTGMFWFFNPENIELAVKVVNGCALNGHRWVLMGGLTDVAVDVEVTEAASGGTRMYGSPGGEPFRTLFDARAFRCEAGE